MIGIYTCNTGFPDMPIAVWLTSSVKGFVIKQTFSKFYKNFGADPRKLIIKPVLKKDGTPVRFHKSNRLAAKEFCQKHSLKHDSYVNQGKGVWGVYQRPIPVNQQWTFNPLSHNIIHNLVTDCLAAGGGVGTTSYAYTLARYMYENNIPVPNMATRTLTLRRMFYRPVMYCSNYLAGVYMDENNMGKAEKCLVLVQNIGKVHFGKKLINVVCADLHHKYGIDTETVEVIDIPADNPGGPNPYDGPHPYKETTLVV